MTTRRHAATPAGHAATRAGADRRRRPLAVTALVALGLAAVVAFVPGIQPGASAATSGGSDCPTGGTAGCQGTVTSLASTGSEVQVHGRGQFAGLTVTVNQTKELVNQEISVSWTGGTPTFSDPSGDFTTTFGGDYLQIFECWGNGQTVNPPDAGSGPEPTQCEFGGESNNPSSAYPINGDDGVEYSRVLAKATWDTYSGLDGSTIPGTKLTTYADASSGTVIEPFQAVDGTVVDQQADYNSATNPYGPEPFWLNPYFSFTTSNEVDFARTYANGTGLAPFQVDTGLEAPGLGCGQDIEPTAHGDVIPQCWLVVVPRSTPAVENPSNLSGVTSVVTSPLTPEAWANRIAIPLQFNPIGTDCNINADSQEIVGGELAAAASASWQPTLCGTGSHTSYSYVQTNDDQARSNISDPTYGSAGMSVFSYPIDPSQLTAGDTVDYAPLTLSGVVIAFNIERVPIVDSDGQLNASEVALSGQRVLHLYLTPRLVAKLLTESYQAQLVDVTNDDSGAYSWVQKNPTSLFTDPDFLQYNPEFNLLSTQEKVDAGTLLVEESSSDAATALWKWVLADKAAREWLSGVPDQWGMQVNPYYSSNTDLNPSGVAFGSPTPETYPKSDPYCENTKETVNSGATARPLCVLDWSPYVNTMRSGAQDAAAANDQAKTTLNPAGTSDTAWAANGPQVTGNDFILTVTDSASAARYGLQTASLAQDNQDADPTFVQPTTTSLLAGEQAMSASAVPGVLQPDPTTDATGAYPLTMLTYGAVAPEGLSATSRAEYAAFIDYAVGAGQVSGDGPGQLPAGYVPLPAALKSQATAAAAAILNPPAKATTPTTTTPTTTPPVAPATVSEPFVAQGTPSTPSSSTPSTPTTTPASVPSHLGPSALATVRTVGIPIGVLRWALPILVLIGLVAALGALSIGRTGKSAAAAAAPTTDAPGGLA